MNVFGYTRVTLGNGSVRLSEINQDLECQREKIKEYCKEKEYTLCAIYTDPLLTPDIKTLHGFHTMLKDTEDNNSPIEAVIMYNLTFKREFHSDHVREQIVSALKEKNIPLITFGGNWWENYT